MWLFTTVGFFSAVQKLGHSHLTIRARSKSDLDTLRTIYLPELSPTTAKGGSDYPWRATIPHAAFGAALQKMVMDVTYANFKDAVAKSQGKPRAHAYHKVWAALLDLPEAPPVGLPAKPKSDPWPEVPVGQKVAYGGVVFNDTGQVLLREPENHYDGYVWTFPKGRPDRGETPEQTALREVHEETGLRARILAPIPGEFKGGTTLNRYYLMTPADPDVPLGPFDAETANIRWATVEEARMLIGQTTNSTGRRRDLAVLEAAGDELSSKS